MRVSALVRRTARLAIMVPFAALLYGSTPGVAATVPPLGGAASFAILGASTVTNTGTTKVTGDLGVSPGTSCTGFPTPCTGGPGTVNGTIHAGDAVAAQAQADAANAYKALVAQACDFTYAPVQEIGGLTLAPGVHCFPSSAFVTGTLTLNGGPTDVWVFKIGSTLISAINSAVVMNGGQDTNVFWAVGSSATLGTGTAFTGNILAVASITLTTGASVSGRAIALNGAVTMDTNNVASRCSSGACQHPLPVPPRGRDVTQLLIDHYQCYQAKPEEKGKRHEVVLEDQFGKRTVTLTRPQMICAPAVKNADPKKPPVVKFPEDLRNPIDHLVCYQINERDGKDIENRDEDEDEDVLDWSDRGEVHREVSVENQFGKHRLTVQKPRMLCVPSLKTLR